MSPYRRAALALVMTCLAAGPLRAQSDLDAQIDAAIERGIKHIWSTQQDTGMFCGVEPNKWSDDYRYPGDREVMAMVALAYAGEDPAKNPAMQKSMKTLIELDLAKTYCLGFRVVALVEIYRRADADLKSTLRHAIRRDIATLFDIQHAHGGFYYHKTTSANSWDFSNTQIALLAFREAVLAGVEVNPAVFTRARALYLEKVREDGGWNYGRPGAWANVPSYGSMTAAAAASLFTIRDSLNPGQGCPCQGGRSAGRRDRLVAKAIDGGVKWLADRFTAAGNPGRTGGSTRNFYWLYAAERVGMHTGLKYFGTHNWYAEGAKLILAGQRRDGSFGRFSDTSFALLFLIKGRGPILMNKLMYDGPWDLHPYDAANLAAYVGDIKEQRINWQVIHLDIPVADMHDAPILYITTEQAIEFSDEHKKKLRDFTDTGGTILFEASCTNREADHWVRTLCEEVWPEWELKAVAKEHPLWAADLMIPKRVPYLRGMDDGLRTFIFFSPRDISCKWHTRSVARNEALFKIGNNLYAYATDRGKLRTRLAARDVGTGKKYADQAPSWRAGDAALAVARLTHGGRWHLNRRYHPWAVLGKALKESVGIDLAEKEPIAAGQDIPPDVDLVYLAGRDKVDLSDDALSRLKAYLSAGGFLFAEATLGDVPFDRSFRAMASAAGMTFRQLKATGPLLSGAVGGDAAGYAVKDVDVTFALRPQRVGKPEPLLYGIYLGDTLVGVYSPFDILFAQTGCKAFDSRGYAAADARALATNLALMVAARKLPPAGD